MGTVLSIPEGPHGAVVTGCASGMCCRGAARRETKFLFCFVCLFVSKLGERCHGGHPNAAAPAWLLLCWGELCGSLCWHPRCPSPDPKCPCRSQPLPHCGGISRCWWGLWFVGDSCGITPASWGLITVSEGPSCYGELEPSNAAAQMSEHG